MTSCNMVLKNNFIKIFQKTFLRMMTLISDIKIYLETLIVYGIESNVFVKLLKSAGIMDLLKRIGDRIRYLRKQRGLSIEALAYQSEIHNNYLGDVERGNRNPSIKSLMKIAHGLEVSVPDLIKFSGGSVPKSYLYSKSKGGNSFIRDRNISEKDWKTFLKVTKSLSGKTGR